MELLNSRGAGGALNLHLVLWPLILFFFLQFLICIREMVSHHLPQGI